MEWLMTFAGAPTQVPPRGATGGAPQLVPLQVVLHSQSLIPSQFLPDGQVLQVPDRAQYLLWSPQAFGVVRLQHSEPLHWLSMHSQTTQLLPPHSQSGPVPLQLSLPAGQAVQTLFTQDSVRMSQP